MSRSSRVRLSVGANASRRFRRFLFSVPLLATMGVLVWVPADLIFESLTADPIDVWGSLVPHVFVAAGFLFGAYVVGAVGSVMLAGVQHAAWLKGTLLGERRWFRTRWVDLATAHIGVHDAPRRVGLSLLVARTVDSGTEVRLPLSHGPHRLPSEELVALADALSGTRVRRGPDDAAFVIADRLRDLAAPARADTDVQ